MRHAMYSIVVLVCLLAALAAHAGIVRLAIPKAEDTASVPFLMLDTGGHMGLIRGVAVSPDGKTLISASEDKTVRIWNWQEGRTTQILRGYVGRGEIGKTYSLALSPGGKLLAVGAVAGPELCGHQNCSHIRLYDLPSGNPSGLLTGHKNRIWSLAFSPDGSLLLSGSDDGAAIVWDVAERTRLRDLDGHAGAVTSAAFSADGAHAITGGTEGRLRFWRVGDGTMVAEHTGEDGHYVALSSITVSPRDGTVATGGQDGEIRFWDAASGKMLEVFAKRETRVTALKFSHDGRKLLSSWGDAGEDEGGVEAHVWDVDSKASVAYDGHALDDIVFSIAVSSDSSFAVTAGGVANTIHIWDMETGDRLKVLHGVGDPITVARFSSAAEDGAPSAVAWGKTVVDAADYSHYYFNSGVLDWRLNLPGPRSGLGNPGALAPEDRGSFTLERHLASNGMELVPGSVQANGFYGAEVRRKGQSEGTFSGLITDYAYAQDIGSLVLGRHFGYIQSYTRIVPPVADESVRTSDENKPTWLFSGQFVGHSDSITSLAIDQSGEFLLSASFDQTIKLWKLDSRELIVTLFHGADGEWVMWTPQGYYISSPGGDKYVGWQINQGADEAARYVTAAQLKRHLYSPEIVSEAIRLGSAEQAVMRLRSDDPTLRDLLARTPPEIAIVAPDLAGGVASRTIEIGVDITGNEDEIECCAIYVNDRLVQPHTDRGALNAARSQGDRSFTVPLVGGENRIRVVASNLIGDTAREVTIENRLAGDLDKRGKLYVVAIGIDDYENIDRPLQYAGKDAREFLKSIVRTAGPIHDSVHTLLVADSDVADAGDADEVLEPSKGNIENALDFFVDAEPQDTVVLFLAGHGDGTGGSYVFLPPEARRKGERWVASSIIKWSLIDQAISETRGRRVLFVDTCHAGGAYNARLIKDAADAGVIAFSAADPETLAQERGDLGHGVFTYSVLRGLAGDADTSGDGNIKVLELADYVSQSVESLTDDQQRPELHAGRTKNFVLATNRGP